MMCFMVIISPGLKEIYLVKESLGNNLSVRLYFFNYFQRQANNCLVG